AGTVTETGTSTSTVTAKATACPRAPEYKKVNSWSNYPYKHENYILYMCEDISAEECCIMCHYGFPSCASWTHWPNSKYNAGQPDYCGAAIRAEHVGGAPKEGISEQCPNGLGDFVTGTRDQGWPEDYVAGKGPC